MGSHGSAAARFTRALATGNPLLARAAATELGELTVADALRYCLFLLEHSPDDYERAALRWHARWILETNPSAEEAALSLQAVLALDSSTAAPAKGLLLELAKQQHQPAIVRALEGYQPQPVEL